MSKYDVIVIGAGPNGMVAAAYLARTGLKVLVLEKRLEAGGGLATEESTLPMFLHNTHSIYHMMVDYAPPYQDLQLESHYGIHYLHPPFQWALPTGDGRVLGLYSDPDRTAQSIAQFSPHDAQAYRDMEARYRTYMERFLGPATYAQPLSALDQAAKLEGSELGRELLALSEKSPLQIIGDLFQNDLVKTLMLYAACHWGLEPDQEGLGFLVPLYLNRATNYRLCRGGSHMLAQALCKIILENGGLILGSERVRHVRVEGDVATAVETENGTVYQADKAIISTLDPHQTFLRFLDHHLPNLDQDMVANIQGWQWEKWSLLVIHLALEGPPHFSPSPSEPNLDQALVYLLGYQGTQDLLDHWQAIGEGRLPPGAGFHCSFPALHDPTQAPAGECTGLITQLAPYELKEGGPDRWLGYPHRETQVNRCLDLLERYAPGTREKVLWWSVCTPADIPNRFPDMVQGSIKQGAYTPFQMGFLRPNPDCSDHRTPIGHLYLGGSSTYPGGLVILGPGYLAAEAVAEDLGLARWWPIPQGVTRARQEGLL